MWKRQSKPTESGGCDGSTTCLPQVSGVLYIYQRNGMNMLIGHACWQRWCTTSTMSGRLTRRDCVNTSPLIVVCKQFHTNLSFLYPVSTSRLFSMNDETMGSIRSTYIMILLTEPLLPVMVFWATRLSLNTSGNDRTTQNNHTLKIIFYKYIYLPFLTTTSFLFIQISPLEEWPYSYFTTNNGHVLQLKVKSNRNVEFRTCVRKYTKLITREIWLPHKSILSK